MIPIKNEIQPQMRMDRLGVALRPSCGALDAEGVLNPAGVRDRQGKLLLYPRMVEKGNISRIGLFERAADGSFVNQGIALEAGCEYEQRTFGDGYGCEDARVTFIPVLDLFVMGYSAFGNPGPRIAIAVSNDGRSWQRIGLTDFSATPYAGMHDKDVAFFPEPVMSPDGVESLAFYHRPSFERDGRIHENIRIAYVPLEPVRTDINAILRVANTVLVLPAGGKWGHVKVGGGTPPIKTRFGWLSLFHGVDRTSGQNFGEFPLTYRAGVIIHDLQRPDHVRYVSPKPLLAPELAEERVGTVNSVVFPTAIDTMECEPETARVFYGMADACIGEALLDFRESVKEADVA